jgi:hypothetical protein
MVFSQFIPRGIFHHALIILVLLVVGSSISDDWSTPPPVQQAPSVAAQAFNLMNKLFVCDYGFSHFLPRGSFRHALVILVFQLSYDAWSTPPPASQPVLSLR